MPRLWPFNHLPSLGDPSKPSLASQTVGPLVHGTFQPCTRPSRECHRSLPGVPLIGDKRYNRVAPVRLRWGNGGVKRRRPTLVPVPAFARNHLLQATDPAAGGGLPALPFTSGFRELVAADSRWPICYCIGCAGPLVSAVVRFMKVLAGYMRRCGGLFGALAVAMLLCCAGPAGVQTNITFPDPKLEAAVRSALGKPTGALTASDLGTRTSKQRCAAPWAVRLGRSRPMTWNRSPLSPVHGMPQSGSGACAIAVLGLGGPFPASDYSL